MRTRERSSWCFRGNAVGKCAALIGALLGAVPGFAQETNRPPLFAARNEAADYSATSGTDIHVRLNAGRIQTSADGLTWIDRPLAIRTFLRGVAYGNDMFVVVGGSYYVRRGVVLTSRDGASWLPQKVPKDVILYGVTHGHGVFVAVGENGAILTSKNGTKWRPQHSESSALLATVAFGNDLFVAGGESGTIMVSSDGIIWHLSNIDSSVYVGRIKHVDRRFVIGNADPVFTSVDGTHWERTQSETVSRR